MKKYLFILLFSAHAYCAELSLVKITILHNALEKFATNLRIKNLENEISKTTQQEKIKKLQEKIASAEQQQIQELKQQKINDLQRQIYRAEQQQEEAVQLQQRENELKLEAQLKQLQEQRKQLEQAKPQPQAPHIKPANSKEPKEGSSLKRLYTITRIDMQPIKQDAAKKTPDQPLLDPKELQKSIQEYLTFQQNFLRQTPWLDNDPIILTRELLSGYTYKKLQPFVLKYTVPAGSHLFFWGDLHSDIRALVDSLYYLFQQGIIDDDLKITTGNHYFFFLGDFVDRGVYGMATLATLLDFARKNPNRVILVRGNHEDFAVISGYEFYDQILQVENLLKQQDPKNADIADPILTIFDLLPDAVFIGLNNNYLQCCHGGYEFRYNPTKLLTDKAPVVFEKIKEFKLPSDAAKYNPPAAGKEKWGAEITGNIAPSELGFLWNDFNATNGTQTGYQKGRGLKIGLPFALQTTTDYSSKNVAVRGIIRAHQHNTTMLGLLNKENQGIYVLWNTPTLDSRVFTLLSSTNVMGNPAFAELTVDKAFDRWQLRSNALFNEVQWLSRTSPLIQWKNIAD